MTHAVRWKTVAGRLFRALVVALVLEIPVAASAAGATTNDALAQAARPAAAQKASTSVRIDKGATARVSGNRLMVKGLNNETATFQCQCTAVPGSCTIQWGGPLALCVPGGAGGACAGGCQMIRVGVTAAGKSRP